MDSIAKIISVLFVVLVVVAWFVLIGLRVQEDNAREDSLIAQCVEKGHTFETCNCWVRRRCKDNP